MAIVAHRLIAFATMILVLTLAASAQAESRVALVVGVGGYANIPELPNTINDARAVSAALERTGFAVDLVLDPKKAALDAAIRRFGERAAGAEAALFYYAGHALESGGKNWIIPVTANIRKARDLPYETSDIDVLLDQLDGAAKLSIIILDSCRENPFRLRIAGGRGAGGSEGLAPLRAATGALIEYSTAPGTVAADGAGSHSPFTEALLHQIEKPGVEVHQVFAEVRREVREATHGRQIPWEASAMEGEFYFRPPAPPSTAHLSPPVSGATASAANEADVLFWKSIADSRDPADFRAYLAQFPNGVFAVLAHNRIRQFDAAIPPATAQTPVAPPPTPTGSAVSDAQPDILDDDALRSRLTAALPSVPDDIRKVRVNDYLRSHANRAFFKSDTSTYRTCCHVNAQQAEEVGFERCEMFYDSPCELLSINQAFLDMHGRHRDMPRLRYAGSYDPRQIPGIIDALRVGADLAGYGAVQGPKAIAIHHWGKIYVATHVRDQRAAEEKALNDCDDDPDRKGRDGPCFLYAAGDQVVLTQRHDDPMDSAGAYKSIIAALARVSPGVAEDRVADYAHQAEPKALAVHPESGQTFWSSGNNESRRVAETLALEGCQQTYGSPCVLLAVGTELKSPDPASAPKRDMPRVGHRGAFAPEDVPFVMIWHADDLRGYPSLPGAKAIAIRAVRTRYNIASGASTVAEAERKALAACNSDNAKVHSPCFVYASDDRVVLPERRTEAKP